MLTDLVNRVLTRVRKHQFDRAAKCVRDTPALTFKKNDDVIIVSQVYHAAVDMTLIALKTFIRQFGEGTVALLDDGSLTDADYTLLHAHIPHLSITHVNDIHLGQCPSGGCWERLIHISNLNKKGYVIQVDTDTISTGMMYEVFKLVKSNIGFTLGGEAWKEPVTLDYLSQYMTRISSQHIQVQAESVLNAVTSISLNRYLRGCAAFTGFPKGALIFEEIEKFSKEMATLVGAENWQRWGSEQFTSNVFISSFEDSVILPWPKYQNYGFPKLGVSLNADELCGRVSLIHFIGSNRFIDNTYLHLAQREIKNLRVPMPSPTES